MRWLRVIALLLSASGAAISVWLAFTLAPQAREAVRAQTISGAQSRAQTKALVTAGLATAMFERDYGRAQELLTQHQDASILASAAVVNSNNAVVALIGSLPDITIGTTIPATPSPALRRTPLIMRSEAVGALIYPAGSIEIDPTVSDGSVDLLPLAANALAVVSLLAFVASGICLLRANRE
jgi:hypothetical protein